MNVKIRYVDMSGSAGPANLASVISDSTKLVMIESPTNPMQRILNIPDICRVAHSKVWKKKKCTTSFPNFLFLFCLFFSCVVVACWLACAVNICTSYPSKYQHRLLWVLLVLV